MQARAAVVALSALVVAFATKDAAAEPTSEPRSPTTPAAPQATTATTPPPETRRWYGWQTLSTDVAAGALAYTYYLSNNVWTGGSGAPALYMLSGATYLLGGPVVHFAHGNSGTGGESLGLRVGAPLVLGTAGCLVVSGGGSDREGLGCLLGAIYGGVVGIVVAVSIDAAVLAYDDAPQPPTPSSPPAQRTFAPTACVGPGWIAIGAAGSF